MGINEVEPKAQARIWPVAGGDGARALVPSDYAEGTPSDLSLLTLWRVLFEWRWFVLSAAALGLAGGLVVSLLATPLYRSTAVLELNPPQVQIMDNTKAGSMGMNEDRNFIPTQIGLLQSRSLAERVVQDLNLASNPALVSPQLDRAARERAVANVLSAGFEVKPTEGSRLVRISFSSPDPALAARVVNGFAASFTSSGLERRYQASSYARNFLEHQLATTRRELEASERQLVAYAQRERIISTGSAQPSGGGAPASGGDTNSLSGANLVTLNNALAEAEGRRIAAEQRYREALRSGAPAEVSDRTAALRVQLAAAQTEYQEKLQLYGPEYPEMARIRSRVQAIEHAIQTESSGTRAARAGALRAEYQAVAAEEQTLRASVNRLQGAVLDQRSRGIQYTILQRDVDTNRALYDALLQRYKEIGVGAGVGASQVSIVDHGDVPTRPYSPNLILNLLGGLALGLFSGFGIALAMELLNDRIKSPDDIRGKLGLAFLGAIPKGSTKVLEDLQDQGSTLSEAYFSLGTSLQFSSDAGVPKTLLLTSTRAGEGKSTSSWAISLSLARIGKRVLLIDADMRKPSFKTGLENNTGLSNLLTDNKPLASHVLRAQEDNIWLLTAGPAPPNPAELLSSNRLVSLLREAAAAYDVVVVDGPPVLGLADAPLLSAVCNGTMLIVESGKTRTKAAAEALNRLRAAGAHLVGGVLTRYRHEAASGYGYYKYEQYRYGQGVEKKSREIRLVTHGAE